jgi:hypothetical protein
MRPNKTHNDENITIDILNNKVVKLLQDLEMLKLIRIRKDKTPSTNNICL